MIVPSVPWWDMGGWLWDRHHLTSGLHFPWGEAVLTTQVPEAREGREDSSCFIPKCLMQGGGGKTGWSPELVDFSGLRPWSLRFLVLWEGVGMPSLARELLVSPTSQKSLHFLVVRR